MSVHQVSCPPVLGGAQVWRPSSVLILLVAMTLALSVVPFLHGLDLMWGWWRDRPEYSHGILMPFLAMFLLWQQKNHFETEPLLGSWWGAVFVLVGALLLGVGRLASALTLVQYAFVITLGGLMLGLAGTRFATRLSVPFVILVLMVPLPEFLFQNLTAGLQLLSSKLGVAIIRAAGVSVYLEGNVIDLGHYKLEVAEACSGLRYLFPLMTLGFIMAYFFKAPLWKRTIVFLSSVPVTILMNSFRIGVIGIMVDRWGTAMAEGFLHDFEGWIIFMASTGVLLAEIAMLSRLSRDRKPWREVFGVDLPSPTPQSVAREHWTPSLPFVTGCMLVGILAALSVLLPERTEAVPARQHFSEMQLQVGNWSGRKVAMENIYLDTLKLDDYQIADYARGNDVINFYVAWYDSQRGGQSAHSPRTCLPGGGWQMTELRQVPLAGLAWGSTPLTVNRALIQMGQQRQLVYYWFQQRGRVLTNEYAVKWYMFWDALTRKRTDGALIRVITPLKAGESLESGDRRLTEFLSTAVPQLKSYVPD